jgi:uncharacterized protein (TIGR03435 family)
MPISKIAVILTAWFLAGWTLRAQSRTHTPAFEVVSIRPSDPVTSIGAMLSYPGGEIRCGVCSLKILIETAFDVDAFQIANLPGWASSPDFAYDIDAKPAATAQSMVDWPSERNTLDTVQRGMMVGMLEDRFQLKFHREDRRAAVYFLSRGDKRLKLEEVTEPRDGFWFGGPHDHGRISGDGIQGSNITMAALAKRLSSYFERPVLDRTGLNGRYNFRYDYITADPHPDILATIISSLRAIGLKLESGKAPIDSIVIEHVQKPTPN